MSAKRVPHRRCTLGTRQRTCGGAPWVRWGAPVAAHLGHEEADLWRRVDAKSFEATAETLQAQTRGKARRRPKNKNANLSNVKRGEEIQARFRPEDE